MKFRPFLALVGGVGLFPYGKSGLKSHSKWAMGRQKRSLPVWEEWIEIRFAGSRSGSRSSLPVWEEWIEIFARFWACTGLLSLPVWEEWIEIARLPGLVGPAASLPVWEEWIEMPRTWVKR